jgi:hypothetical protein
MLLVGPNLFMSQSVCLIFDIQWPLVRVKIEVSSLAPEHVIKPDELRFRSGYRWTGNHRSDASIRTKLINCL